MHLRRKNQKNFIPATSCVAATTSRHFHLHPLIPLIHRGRTLIHHPHHPIHPKRTRSKQVRCQIPSQITLNLGKTVSRAPIHGSVLPSRSSCYTQRVCHSLIGRRVVDFHGSTSASRSAQCKQSRWRWCLRREKNCITFNFELSSGQTFVEIFTEKYVV